MCCKPGDLRAESCNSIKKFSEQAEIYPMKYPIPFTMMKEGTNIPLVMLGEVLSLLPCICTLEGTAFIPVSYGPREPVCSVYSWHYVPRSASFLLYLLYF